MTTMATVERIEQLEEPAVRPDRAVIVEDYLWAQAPDPSRSYRYTLTLYAAGRVLFRQGFDVLAFAEAVMRMHLPEAR